MLLDSIEFLLAINKLNITLVFKKLISYNCFNYKKGMKYYGECF